MSPKELCFFVPSNYKNQHGARKGPWWGMNEIMQSQRSFGKGRVDRQKLGAETHVAEIAAHAMAQHGWVAPDGPCEVVLTFVEVGRSRDPDNVFGGAKYIMDALCERDDSQRYVTLRCAIAERTDRENPGVWVRIRRREEA